MIMPIVPLSMWTNKTDINTKLFSNVDLFNNKYLLPDDMQNNNNYLWTSHQLFVRFYQKNYNRMVGFPFLTNNDNAINFMVSIVDNYTKSNYYKYTKLLKSLTSDYNPIENYNMVENGDDKSQSETDTTLEMRGGEERTTKTEKGQTYTDNTTFNNVTDTHQNTGTTKYQGSETQSNSATTYDNVNTDWLTDKQNTEFNNRQDTISSSDSNVKNGSISNQRVYGMGADSESVNNEYKNRVDVTTINNYSNNTHILTRSGNIGVTTTQQMLQSEREVAHFNIIDDYLDGVSNEIMLNFYDWYYDERGFFYGD